LVKVETNRIFTPSQEYSINLSYRENEGPVWKPVMAKIRNSIAIVGGK
jgi:hypothetical protein